MMTTGWFSRIAPALLAGFFLAAPADAAPARYYSLGTASTAGTWYILGAGFSNRTLKFPAFPRGLELSFGDGVERYRADSTAAPIL